MTLGQDAGTLRVEHASYIDRVQTDQGKGTDVLGSRSRVPKENTWTREIEKTNR